MDNRTGMQAVFLTDTPEETIAKSLFNINLQLKMLSSEVATLKQTRAESSADLNIQLMGVVEVLRAINVNIARKK